jgi:hypothetical protein
MAVVHGLAGADPRFAQGPVGAREERPFLDAGNGSRDYYLVASLPVAGKMHQAVRASYVERVRTAGGGGSGDFGVLKGCWSAPGTGCSERGTNHCDGFQKGRKETEQRPETPSTCVAATLLRHIGQNLHNAFISRFTGW